MTSKFVTRQKTCWLLLSSRECRHEKVFDDCVEGNSAPIQPDEIRMKVKKPITKVKDVVVKPTTIVKSKVEGEAKVVVKSNTEVKQHKFSVVNTVKCVDNTKVVKTSVRPLYCYPEDQCVLTYRANGSKPANFDNLDYFTNLGFDAKQNSGSWNPHHDLAELRRIFEFRNVNSYLEFSNLESKYLREFVDVGGSPRLATSGLRGTVLWPSCGYQDFFRQANRNAIKHDLSLLDQERGEIRCKISDLKFEDFFNTSDCHVNGDFKFPIFTDSMYYMKPHMFHSFLNVPRGIVGAGSMHVFKKSGAIEINSKVYGAVKISNLLLEPAKQLVEMSVVGNENTYSHANTYSALAKRDTMILLQERTQVLVLKVIDRVNLGCTDYVRFVIVHDNINGGWDHSIIKTSDVVTAKVAFQPKKKVQKVLVGNNSDVVDTAMELPTGTLYRDIDKGKSIIVSCNKGKVRGQVISKKIKDLDDLDTYTQYVVKPTVFDFEVKQDVITKTVFSLVTEKKKITRDSLIQIAQSVSRRVDSLDVTDFLIPILTKAISQSIQFEAQILSLVESDAVTMLDNFREGNYTTKSNDLGLVERFVLWVFGRKVVELETVGTNNSSSPSN